MEIPSRLAQKFIPEPNSGCWLWVAAKSTFGYGRIRYDGRQQQAHRVLYELLVGTIPTGLFLDHRCRQPACVNPSHLEAVTHLENVRRSLRNICIRGHSLTGDNLATKRSGGRRCRSCDREAKRLQWAEWRRVGLRRPRKRGNALQCGHGHIFDEKNTRLYSYRGRLLRFCRACERAKSRALPRLSQTPYRVRPLAVKPIPRTRPTPMERFEAKVRRLTVGCWEWQGVVERGGYGIISIGRTSTTAHRRAYSLYIGAIPCGHHIDHICCNRRCVNPAHLEAVTQGENNRRIAARRVG